MVLFCEGKSEGQGEEEDDAKDWRMIRHYYRIADLQSREPAIRTHVTSLAERLERETRLLKVPRSWRTIRRKTKEAVKTTSWVTLDPNVGQLVEQRALGSVSAAQIGPHFGDSSLQGQRRAITQR